MIEETLVWAVRYFIYQHFVATTQPPSIAETAGQFQISPDDAIAVYQDLHHRDALFLEPGTVDVRMAFPFSGVPTPFKVHAQGKTYYANCAWDSLGIPAALHSDAVIETVCAWDGRPISLTVENGRVGHHSEVVHYLVPFRQWYDNLAYT
jgi:hypothetical protein